MPSSLQILLIGTLAVVIATAAPLTNQEKLVNVDQAGESAGRAKRAEEEIVFGNQQNKARVVAKKSDLSNILAHPESQGEHDLGAQVIVHKEMPVGEELAARAEAGVGSASENKEKMKDAVEAAMESVAEVEKAVAESKGQIPEKVESEEKAIKQLAQEELEESEQGTGEASEAAEEKEDEDLKDLQKAAAASAVSDNGANKLSTESKIIEEDLERYLQETAKQGQTTENNLDRDREGAYENRMRNYLMSLGRGLPYLPYMSPYLPRYRRSPHAFRTAATSKGNKRARRIKRDLLDDDYYYYSPYSTDVARYSPEEDEDDDLISSPEEYELTDEEAEYLYNYLAQNIDDNDVPDTSYPSQEKSPMDSYLDGYEEAQNEPYAPYDIYTEDDEPLNSGYFDNGYPYEPVDFDSYQNYVKRGMIDYYPEGQDEEKRYFFPFNKEPETHWGAFVPEKRDYGEAIQRLQRLAMALSDNPGPYYREMLEEYRK